MKHQLNIAIQALLLKVNSIYTMFCILFFCYLLCMLNVCECNSVFSRFSSLLFHAQFVHCMCASYSFAIYLFPLKEPKWFLLFLSYIRFVWNVRMETMAKWLKSYRFSQATFWCMFFFLCFVSRNKRRKKSSQRTQKNWTFANSSKYFVWMFVGIFQF